MATMQEIADIETLVFEMCAKIAEAHMGAATRRRQELGQRLSAWTEDVQIEVCAEERGEDIAAESIARAIRAAASASGR